MISKYYIVDDGKILQVVYGTHRQAKKVGTIIDRFLTKKAALEAYSQLARLYYDI